MSSISRQELFANFELLGRQMGTATVLFHEAVGEAVGLSPIELRAIELIERLGPLTAGELASQTSLTTGAITNLLDRLESRRLIKRLADPTDRRKVIIQVQHNKTLNKINSLYDSLCQAWQRLYTSYSLAELERFSDFMERAITMMQEETGKVTKNTRS
jgi:DNA-binding MarR family transcriptional regulator